MSLIDNIDKVALTSAYPTDKIVGCFEGNFNVATAEIVQDSIGSDVYSLHRINHDFGRPVFTKLKWSLDGVNWVDGGLGQTESDPLIIAISVATPHEIKIMTTLYGVGTLYYKVICFWIDDYDTTNPLVEPYQDPNKPFNFDSRLNYQKIYKQGEIVFTGLTDTDSVLHDLEYIPNAWIFFESLPGEVWPAIVGGAGNAWLYRYDIQGELDYTITDHALELSWEAGASFTGNARCWYNIYLDS